MITHTCWSRFVFLIIQVTSYVCIADYYRRRRWSCKHWPQQPELRPVSEDKKHSHYGTIKGFLVARFNHGRTLHRSVYQRRLPVLKSTSPAFEESAQWTLPEPRRIQQPPPPLSVPAMEIWNISSGRVWISNGRIVSKVW